MSNAVGDRTAVTRAAESSAILRLASRSLGGWAAWARRTNARLAVGLRGRSARPTASPEQLRMVADDSLTLRALSRLIDIPVNAWHDAAAKRMFDTIFALDLGVRMSLLGWMLIAAVVTHIVVVAVLGVRVYLLGWSTRAVLAVLAVALITRPAAFAAAWRERHARHQAQSEQER